LSQWWVWGSNISGEARRKRAKMGCMELKVLGHGDPPDDFADNLKTLLSAQPPAWDALARWFVTTDSFDVDDAVASPVAIASPLAPAQYRSCVRVLQYLLEAWRETNKQLSDLQQDLLVLGLTAIEVDRLGTLLKRLEPVKDRVYASFMRFEHENAVLPTLEDIDVVCDIRPVFEDYVYPLPENSAVNHTKLLGFSYMVLMELFTEDIEGETRKISFQMTEDTLADFQVALKRASEQLDILKARTHDLQTSC
jgi:hypothetical protein